MQWDNPISPDSAGSTLVIRIPRGLRSKEKLLGIFAERLRFPRYFGWNWDAFEECLRDLSWLPEGQAITVVHEALPFSEGDNRETYLSILSNWRATACHSVKFILL
jgi:Barstar (barnase inhibitor)